MSPAVVSSNIINTVEESLEIKNSPKYKWDIVWDKVILLAILNGIGIYGWLIVYKAHLYTIIYSLSLGYITGFGLTGGYHRLWAHRSYKAKLPLQILLMLLATAAGEGDIHYWVREHRVHHKFSETDADPHNAKRGFFFAHVGWLMVRKHPDIKKRGKEIDMSDILEDPVVQFQMKYYIPLCVLLSFILPPMIPPYFWGESWYISILAALTRYATLLNATWCVNSAAHLWGHKPYDKRMNPVENKFVSFFCFGEGWHNYHHLFPWDYKASELPYHINFTTLFIDMFAKIGWAYDLKTTNPDMIKRVVQKHGDGSHSKWGKIAEIKNLEDK